MTFSPPPSISEPSREELARALCLRLLTARARTRAELSGQLARRGYPDDVSDRVLDRLAGVGLVDDTDFAQQWVSSRRANAGKSKRALAAELHTKGVGNEVITENVGIITYFAGGYPDKDRPVPERPASERPVAGATRRGEASTPPPRERSGPSTA